VNDFDKGIRERKVIRDITGTLQIMKTHKSFYIVELEICINIDLKKREEYECDPGVYSPGSMHISSSDRF
jgi:hypothetical protein